MGKKRLSPRGPALLHACETDRSVKQYDHDGGRPLLDALLFFENFLFSVNEHGKNRSIWVKTERGDCQ